MQTDERQTQSQPEPEEKSLTTTPTTQVSSHEEVVRVPAKLPPHSRAAASQRLNDIPAHAPRGFYYEATHRRLHPTGWRTRRYVKRKNLRLTQLHGAAVERLNNRTMLSLACSLLIFFVIAASILVSVTSIVQATQLRYGEQITTLEDILPKDSLKLYDKNGTLIYHMTQQGVQTSVPLSQISQNFKNAEIAIEDQYFWTNSGFDITGIVRAAIDDLTHGHVVSGGSTITQQLIKNAIVGNKETITRKLQEIILAPSVTRYYTKEQILSYYLNTTYYGEQAYGAEAAAYTYFSLKDTPTQSAAAQLTIAQSAMIAGIPSSPIARDPILHPKAAFVRMQEVLRQMYAEGYITHNEEMQAIAEGSRPDFIKPGSINKANSQAPHFSLYAINELAKDLHVKVTDLPRSGLIVQTTLDLPYQNQVLKIAQKHIAELAVKHHMSNAAEVVIDNHDGSVRALLGNIDPNNPKDGAFDVASQGYRQPGSSFKPFIYATAFGDGISPGTAVYDGPLTVQMCCGLPSYTPMNYDRQYHGLITYRYALQNSFNIPAVKLLMQTGVDKALHTAQVMGLETYEGTPNYTMVLGSLSVRLIDMTSAYSVFANYGTRIPPHAIAVVKNTQGKVIYQPSIAGKRVISKQVSYMITNVLSDNHSRTFEFGQCSALYLYTTTQQQCYAGKPGDVRPAAVKTGTSNDFRDNWTVGYTTDYTIGVWAGNNNNSAMVDVTGVDGAAPIWHEAMLLIEKGHPIQNFTNPGGLVQKTVNGVTDLYLK